jgi:hypothetical protein
VILLVLTRCSSCCSIAYNSHSDHYCYTSTDILIYTGSTVYFGKRNFSIRRLMYIDREGAWHYLHYLWIASLFASILFSMIGLLLLVLVPQDLDVVSIASLSFMSAIVIVGLAFEACKRKSRLSTVYFPSLYL